MIKIDKEKTEITGSPDVVMAEFASMWWNGIDYIAEKMDVNPNDLRDEIQQAGTYINLIESGMTEEEAKEVMDAKTT